MLTNSSVDMSHSFETFPMHTESEGDIIWWLITQTLGQDIA